MSHVITPRLMVPLALTLAIAANPALASPVAIVVNSTADTTANDGFCTLREAITAANTNTASGNLAGECVAGVASVDTIDFNIPDTDAGCTGNPKVCTIKPANLNWPHIEAAVKIDGYSQHGASVNSVAAGDNAVLLIELDATNLTSAALYLAGPLGDGDSSGSTIQGLVISHINNSVRGICTCDGTGSDNNVISGNFIGTDATGTALSSSVGATAIDLSGSIGTIIGGTTPDKRNVMATGADVVHLITANNNSVQGNYIGLDRTGTVTLASGRGVDIEVGSANLIGGAAAGAGNVIGTWSDYAVILQSGSNNLIQGNLIGTDHTGTVWLGGGNYGVGDFNGAGTGNKFGGDADGEGNVIAGATVSGVELFFDTSSDLVVQGNTIEGNAEGILVYDGAGSIGGTTAGAGNRIAFNGSFGVSIFATANNVPILGNAIYANGSLGITLSNTGIPTPNDGGDGDSGNNNLQNYPVVSSVTISPKTTVHVSGSLNSTPNAAFRVEFFANANCDPSGNGEGKIFIGFANVTTTPNPISFGQPLTLDFTVPADRHVITATATDPNGNTSEFSACATQDTIFSDGVEGN